MIECVIVVHRKMVSGMTLELEQLRGKIGKGNLILELLVLALLLVAIIVRLSCLVGYLYLRLKRVFAKKNVHVPVYIYYIVH